jgi:hypothetical protein
VLDTTMQVIDSAEFPSATPYRIKIGAEYLLVTGGAGTTNWTVARDSSARGHSVRDPVTLVPPNPFAVWHEGTDGDYHTMLTELWAYLADILTFYQERIANEAYLSTATQRDSLLRLAELINHRPSCGAGASALLAFTAEKGKSVPVPKGFRTGSRATPGKTAAVFETEAAITARGEHSAIPLSSVAPTNQFAPLSDYGALFGGAPSKEIEWAVIASRLYKSAGSTYLKTLPLVTAEDTNA